MSEILAASIQILSRRKKEKEKARLCFEKQVLWQYLKDPIWIKGKVINVELHPWFVS